MVIGHKIIITMHEVVSKVVNNNLAPTASAFRMVFMYIAFIHCPLPYATYKILPQSCC